MSHPPRARRCAGYCGLPIPPEKTNTYQVIEPSGCLREFCDSDCLRFFYLDSWRAFLRSEGMRGDGCLCNPTQETWRWFPNAGPGRRPEPWQERDDAER